MNDLTIRQMHKNIEEVESKKAISNQKGSAITVDCVILGYNYEGLKVLLIECDTVEYFDRLSLIGDYVYDSETLDQAATRIVKERSGLTNIYLEQVHAFGDPNRHPKGRVVSIAYYSLVKVEDFKLIDKQNIRPKWVPVNEVQNLAFDHDQILANCISTLRKRLRQMPIGFSLLPKKFSLLQLQELYENVLGIELDKRNFRRKLSNLELLIDLDEWQENVSHRPAKLYSFNFEKYHDLRRKGRLAFEL